MSLAGKQFLGWPNSMPLTSVHRCLNLPKSTPVVTSLLGEVYSELYQTSNGRMPLIIFAKRSISDVLLGSEYASDLIRNLN